MKKIFDIKEGDWIPAEQLQKLLPGVTKTTVYNWRKKIASGEADVDDYPKTKSIGGKMLVNRESLIEFLNKDDFQEAG